MSVHKNYAVLGLGKYGTAVAKELSDNGADVMAVDMDSKKLENLVSVLPVCKCADVTDPEAIRQLGISNMDTVVICMASNLEAGIMATMLCKEAGVQEIIVKCSNPIHQSIFEKIGADTVVLPEIESGIRLAKNLLSSGFVDIADLSDDISIIELNVKAAWEGKSLAELDLRKKYSVNIIAVRENGKTELLSNPHQPLSGNMKLIAVGVKKDINKII